MNDLEKLPIWVCWKRDPERGKIPISPKTGGNAQSNNPGTWTTYEQAEAASAKYDGIGFMFTDGICGIDIDSINGDPAQEQRAQDIIAHMDTYTEYSPSGNGYHIIFRCDVSKVPQEKVKNAKGVYVNKLLPLYHQKNVKTNIECYISGLTNRYFTYTGEAVNDMDVEDRTEQLLSFLDQYMKKPTAHAHDSGEQSKAAQKSLLDNSTIIKKARKAKNGPKFSALFDHGDISEYKNDDSSADIALCNILAWWCGGVAEQINELFGAVTRNGI